MTKEGEKHHGSIFFPLADGSVCAVPGVARAQWQTSKAPQGNVSAGHDMQQHVFVYATKPGSAGSPMGFELTRGQHQPSPSVPFTVTARFKEPPAHLPAEAWRI